jgi:hypothetical protein
MHCHSTHVSVLSFTPVRKVQPSLCCFLWNAMLSGIMCRFCIADFTLNGTINVESTKGNCRSQWPCGLRHRYMAASLLRSHRGHGCLSVVSVMRCQVEVSATNWPLVQRSPTDCGMSCVVLKKQTFVNEEEGQSPLGGSRAIKRKLMELSLCPLVKYDLFHASFCRVHNHSVNLCEHFLYQIFSSSDKNKDWALFSLHLLVKRGRGAYARAVCWGTVLQAGRFRVQFLMVSLGFFIILIVPAALWHWGWLSF